LLAAVGKRKYVLSSYSGGAMYAMEMLTQVRKRAVRREPHIAYEEPYITRKDVF
jgi:hypothetical protein